MTTLTEMLEKLDADFRDQNLIIAFSTQVDDQTGKIQKVCSIYGTKYSCVAPGESFIESLNFACYVFRHANNEEFSAYVRRVKH